MEQHVRAEIVEGGVGILTLDRPARFNSLDPRTAQDLRSCGLKLARDDRARAVIFRGVPGMFCSGADLKYIRAGGAEDEVGYLSPGARAVPKGYGEIFKQILEYLHSTISEIRRSPKPWIASVDGIAAAGGLGLAMCCDLVVASERAVFEWAYGKTALTGAESSTFHLPRIVGFRKAAELCFLNPRLDARAALEAGLVTRVLPTEGFDDAVLALARQVAAGPTRSYGVTKRLLTESLVGERLDRHLDEELEELSRIADTADFAEGLTAFFEKRPPKFEGR